MKRYLWLTDIHLSFLSNRKLKDYIRYLDTFQSQGILISGDVSTGNNLEEDLSYFIQHVNCPVYFVLGNHDFYHSSFSEIESRMIILQSNYPNQTKYLDLINEPISLSSEIGLVGQSSWYDTRWEEPLTSAVFWYDFFLIKEFRVLSSMKERIELAYHRANEEACRALAKLRMALEKYSTVYFLTHFPPWPEATHYSEGLLGRFWVPYSTSKVMADNLMHLMQDYPTKKLVILSGHTHYNKIYCPTSNIEVQVGASSFGTPGLSGIIYVE